MKVRDGGRPEMKAVARQGEAVATLARQVDDAVRECRRLLI